MKVVYYKMTTTIHQKIVDVDDITDMDAIRKEVELHTHLHGWDKITPAEEREWIMEHKEDDDVLAKNPLYY